MEEIGNRATMFSLDSVHGANREYICWLLEQCAKPGTGASRLFEDEAVDLLAERLTTPLQTGQHLTLALEEAFQIGGRPVTTEVVESVKCNRPADHIFKPARGFVRMGPVPQSSEAPPWHSRPARSTGRPSSPTFAAPG
jgi:hypothetical protein